MILGSDNSQACKNLFHFLRQAEKLRDCIIAAFIENGNMKEDLYNRMSKAASGHIL